MKDEKIWIFSDTESEGLTNILINNFFSLGLSDNLQIYDRIDNIEDLRKHPIHNVDQIIYFVFSNKEMSKYLDSECREKKIKFFDVYNIISGILGKMVARISMGENIVKLVDENLHKNFVDFAKINDDGRNPDSLIEADIVIIGISRTTKTPLSIYMSNQGYKVTNLPLVPEISLPEKIFKVPKKRIFALTMSEERLMAIRNERLKSLGLPKNSTYASPERIREEIEHSKRIVEKLGCHSIDVSHISIEETSDIIKNLLNKN